MLAVSGMMAAHPPGARRGVERIPLDEDDDEWPEDDDMTLACGIDVGGTKIAGGVVDESGAIIEELQVESPATDVHAIEAAIETLVTELTSRHAIEAVGVGAAGYIDKARSVVLFAPNLAWRDLDLKADLEKTLEPAGRRRERRERGGLGRVPVRCRPRRRRPAAGHRRHRRRRWRRARRLALPRCVRRRRRDRPHAGGARRHPLRLRQPRMLRDVRQRLGARARGTGRRAGRLPARRGPARPGRWRRRRDHGSADHRGRPRRRPLRRRAARRRSAAGWARASRRSPPCSTRPWS